MGFQPTAEDLDYPGKLERAQGQSDNGHTFSGQLDSSVRHSLRRCWASASHPPEALPCTSLAASGQMWQGLLPLQCECCQGLQQ